ncbi:hypothetical protein MMC13_002174 [Lambiella insularis]|nr:hypothetical protein [Lambiella insularis]
MPGPSLRVEDQQATSSTSSSSGTEQVFKKNGERFTTSTVWTIAVGPVPNATFYYVHETVLSQSPVFAALFAETSAGKPSLTMYLDDDPEPFAYTIEYLYAKNFYINPVNGIQNVIKTLGQVYLLAHKYKLDRLKLVAMAKLVGMYDFLQKEPLSFFQMSRDVYEATASEDKIFKPVFRKLAAGLLAGMQDELYKNVVALARQGGDFAVDMVHAQRSRPPDAARAK